MHPQLDDLIAVCARAWGRARGAGRRRAVGQGAIRQVKDFGAKLICFAPALALAKRLVRAGADALVIEGAEAGGHIGPVVTSVLAQEILPNMADVPVFVAGGIGRGEAILSYLEMGGGRVPVGNALRLCVRMQSRIPISRRRSSAATPVTR